MTIHENTGDLILATTLNRDCFCVTLIPEVLDRTLESECALSSVYRSTADERPHLFATTPYFVSYRQVERMAKLVHAVETVVALPAYREHALAWAPEIARFEAGPLGVFFGYDFHLDGVYPQLIEINTNAGGALLNTVLARAQLACCQEMDGAALLHETIAPMEQNFIDMFQAEWRRQRGGAPLTSIAIVDVDPERQYLSLEFRLFRRLFQKNGIAAVVADPSEMELRDDGLWYRDLRIDLVYNRLTDFALREPSNAVLHRAYLNAHVVLTPHPRAHALYADKRNLTLLCDDALLRSWCVPDSIRAVLRSGIPRTVRVTHENCDMLWAARRRLFFKPAAGYGSKAAYRGDKLTRRVWEEIRAGEYVAQELAPPGQRRLPTEGEPVALKVDVRNYVYDGQVQLLGARMYQGQTTNFRTAGGGFAAVFVIGDTRSWALRCAGAQTPDSANRSHFFIRNHPSIHERVAARTMYAAGAKRRGARDG